MDETWTSTTDNTLTALAPILKETSQDSSTYQYTLYVIICATFWVAAKYVLNNCKSDNSIDDAIKTKSSSHLKKLRDRRDSLKNLKKTLMSKEDTTIQEEIERLQKENLIFKRKLEIQKRLAPIRMAKNELSITNYDSIIQDRRAYLNKILTLHKSAKENNVLKNRLEYCKYDQIKAINNIIGLKNLLDVMRGVELEHQSNNLKDETFEAKVHIEFIHEQMETLHRLTEEFIRFYEGTKQEIEREKAIDQTRREEYNKLREELTELRKVSIDEWNRKISDKMADAYRFYRNYINDYYKVQSYAVEW